MNENFIKLYPSFADWYKMTTYQVEFTFRNLG